MIYIYISIETKTLVDIFGPTILLNGTNGNTMLQFLPMNGVQMLAVFAIPSCIGNIHVCFTCSSWCSGWTTSDLCSRRSLATHLTWFCLLLNTWNPCFGLASPPTCTTSHMFELRSQRCAKFVASVPEIPRGWHGICTSSMLMSCNPVFIFRNCISGRCSRNWVASAPLRHRGGLRTMSASPSNSLHCWLHRSTVR